jgi:hypothetical protein
MTTMNYALISRMIGSALLLTAAVFIGLGGKALWNGRPSDWPDLTATDEVAIASSRWALVLAAIFSACAVANFMNASWGFLATAVTLAVAIGILFWGHYVLFGTWDPTRIAMNVAIAGFILWLLWKGSPATE